MYLIHSKPNSSKRRVTVAGEIKGTRLYLGVACCSHHDVFKRKRGAEMASGRALKAPNAVVEIPLEVRQSNKIGTFFCQEAQKLIKMVQDSNTLPRYESGRAKFMRKVIELIHL